MRKRSFASRLLRLSLYAVIGWFVVTFAIVGSLRWVDPPTSAFMIAERWGRPDQGIRHSWVDANLISGPMQVAVIASEDQNFPNHHGFDLDSIDKALEERERGRVRGASTISQQVAKNLFLWGGRSWVRKGLEAYFTVVIELTWPKQRILEVYLNIAEFGPGIYGVGAASKAFFRKPPSRLSTYDAALLAAVLPNPKRLRANAPSDYVRSRQEWIVGQMRSLGGEALLTRVSEN